MSERGWLIWRELRLALAGDRGEGAGGGGVMTNDDARDLLTRIYRELMSTYPMPEGSTVDLRLAMTIGFVAGAICEGLDAEREDRPLRVL